MSDKMRRLREQSAEDFHRLRLSLKPDLGTHKRTRLTQAGCSNSGSLLHDDVSSAHARMLRKDFKDDFENSARENLRFLTILHEVIPLDVDRVAASSDRMKQLLRESFAETGARCTGAIEIEIVSLKKMRRASGQSPDGTRKLTVLESILDPSDPSLDTGLLIHFHGVVDMSNSILQDDAMKSRLKSTSEWGRSAFQIELKNFFQSKPVAKSLDDIAAYLTKGGNERLRFNPRFGRDEGSELDAKIWRKGQGRADKGGDTYPDELALSFSEISFLDQAWGLLMRRGYILTIA